MEMFRRRREGDVVRVSFEGASPSARTLGVATINHHSNFIGNGVEINEVPHFKEARLVNVLPGVSARYYVDSGAPRYDLILAPGVQPNSVQLKYENAKNLRVGADGSLQYDIRFGTVREEKLFVYQDVEGVRKQVPASFQVRGQKVSFQVAEYDQSKPLVIDPQIFISGTYLGGLVDEHVGSVDVSPNGTIVAAGYTSSTDFPTIATPYNTDSTSHDWFVTNFNRSLSSLGRFSTYISGNGYEYASGLRVRVLDNQDIILAGTARSTDLPSNGIQSANAFDLDGYVIRLRANAGTRQFSTYLGGNTNDYIWDMDVNPATGDMAIAMETLSTDLNRTITQRGPLTAGTGADTTRHGATDAFVIVLGRRFDSVQMGSYYGGDRSEAGKVVAFGKGYESVVMGGESSSTTGLTFQRGAISSTTTRDLFVTRFDLPTGNVLHSVAFGSTGATDTMRGIVLNEVNDQPTVTGLAAGTFNTAHWNTPTLPIKFGHQSTTAGGQDAFIVSFGEKLNQAIATYFGGTGNDSTNGIALQSNGSVQVVGLTVSSDLPLLSTGGTNVTATAASSTNQQGFLARFSNGLNLTGSNYIGGTTAETGTGFATHDTPLAIALEGPYNNAIVGGATASTSLQLHATPYSNSGVSVSGFLQTYANQFDPRELQFSYNVIPKTQTQWASVVFNAPVVVAGTQITFTITGPARFRNGTQTFSTTVPTNATSQSVKIWPNASISTNSSVGVSVTCSGSTISNSFTVTP